MENIYLKSPALIVLLHYFRGTILSFEYKFSVIVLERSKSTFDNSSIILKENLEVLIWASPLAVILYCENVIPYINKIITIA